MYYYFKALLLFFIIPVLVSINVLNSNAISLSNINDQSPNYSNLTAFKTYIPLDKSEIIGIQLSQVCINLIKNNIPSNCLTYDKLKQFDNTDPKITGQWIDTPYFHKLKPKIKNVWQFASKNGYMVLVDPPNDFTTKAKMIIIQSDNFTYTNPDESVGNNHTRNEYFNRFVAGCTTAIVSPNIQLINDTIKYMESGCVSTNFINHESFKTGNTPGDFLHSIWYQYKSWLDSSKKINLQNCITHNCVKIKNPQAKW